MLAYVVVLFAASLKYYPITLLILSIRERLPIFLAITVITTGLIAFFIVHYLPALELGIPLIPDGSYFANMFGAKNIPRGIASLAFASHLVGPPNSLSFEIFVGGLYGVLLLGIVTICRRLLADAPMRVGLSRLPRIEKMFLLIGSILIVGCFFAGQNINYRGIYLLMVLPGFLVMARDNTHLPIRKLGISSAIVVVSIMWSDPFHTGLAHLLHRFVDPPIGAVLFYFYFWLARELAWWWLISIMTAILLDWLARSDSIHELLRISKRNIIAQKRSALKVPL